MAPSFHPLQPTEALRFFKRKGLTPTFAWQDLWQEEHARAFTVAKSAGFDILGEVFSNVKSALEDGKTFDMFRKELEPTLIKKGWWGKKDLLDPLTGEVKTAQLGSRRRLKIIYDTNLRMARAAGQWERIERVKARRPWLAYSAVKDGRTRPRHRAWGSVVLPVDDPWWNTHYPPNGFHCRCGVLQLSDRDLARRGLVPTQQPPVINTKPYTNPRTGEVMAVPVGIDPGFAYNVGKGYLRPITPSPSSAPLSQGTPLVVPNAPALTPLPVRQVPETRILPSGLADEEYYQKFVDDFKLPEKGGFFVDVTGTPIPINENLFRDGRGNWKIKKRGREIYTLLMADVIKHPEEIWEEFVFHHKRAKYILNRRYLARFQIENQGKLRDGFALFEMTDDEWFGLTIFSPKTLNYIERYRSGILNYKKRHEK
ncbi:PBECR2 nuclease fold domain-containing protein [Paremcibacter congregatus]|uniref:PBECR2 nuclease fold domain-containing protein n=1 Tax=Paremcibacter congregatus TaxID=2043170 RepID=UPI0030ED8EE2|tara:strand:+ start:3716 stop:4993 length:1278 start_codon:yes stop_codon:yes gene_type:complete